MDEPTRWGPWVAPCPIRDSDRAIQQSKVNKHRKARMDQRTRERLPALPLLVRTAQERLTTASRRLHATCSVEPGQDFNVDCRPWHRPVLARNRQRGALVWAVDPDTGNRRDLATGADLVTAGHENVETTMRYKAVYPEEAIEAYRAFIARRRSERPSAEYRTPTEAEWDDFLAHFEKRKLSVGICARAFSTPCIHEHACVRCSLLRPDPAQRYRLEEIRDNLRDRIAEAEREGWLGEIEGLQVSLAGANNKTDQIDRTLEREAVDLGMPRIGRPVGPR
ncbi:hypothetical protein ACWGVR_12880 [Streptomyces xanthophaeus]